MNRRKEKLVRDGIWLGVILVFLMIIMGSVHSIVEKMRERGMKPDKEYEKVIAAYEQLEEEYQEELGDILAKEGYPYSGITMTYITDMDGNRDYKVQIHHRRMKRLDEQQQEELVQVVSKVDFTGGTCSFFLM